MPTRSRSGGPVKPLFDVRKSFRDALLELGGIDPFEFTEKSAFDDGRE
jgi:hypothetical protein